MPDFKSLRTSTLEPRYAYLMGQFEEKEGELKQVDICPRTILNRIVKYPPLLTLSQRSFCPPFGECFLHVETQKRKKTSLS